MAWAMAAVAGAGIVGGMINSSNQAGAASDAAGMQMAATQQGLELQRQMYEQGRKDTAPYRAAGVAALGSLQDPGFQHSFGMSDFNADPGYQFRMSEGQKAIERSAAARGGLNSGATLKALTNYGQNTGSQEYENAYNRFNNDQTTRFNRLASVAGIGQTANGQALQSGMNYANQGSGLMAQAGNAQAAGAIGQANAVTSGIGMGLNSLGNYAAMNRIFPSQSSAPSGGGDVNNVVSYGNGGGGGGGTSSALGDYNYGF